jgi:hypothetical protein
MHPGFFDGVPSLIRRKAFIFGAWYASFSILAHELHVEQPCDNIGAAKKCESNDQSNG